MTQSALSWKPLPRAFVIGQFSRALMALVRAFKDRQEVRHLAQFDDRMLKDIGLTRDDVMGALAEPIHHHPSWVLVQSARWHAQNSKSAQGRRARPVVPLVGRV